MEDLGFLGGVGTDPNSMLPMALIFIAGYVAMVRVPVAAEVRGGRGRGSGPRPRRTHPSDDVVGARASLSYPVVRLPPSPPWPSSWSAPRRWRPRRSTATPTPSCPRPSTAARTRWSVPAPQFTLTDQHGRTVSLASLRGHTVALTFLDPVCTSDCPLIAQEFRQTDLQLGAARAQRRLRRDRGQPDLPIDRPSPTPSISQESMNRLPNWYYLTGSVAQLQRSGTPTGSW